jgi:2,4-dienoyl-CoA reductase-like NADH-dependent reductase (Old Yellow Enzyme family)/thioredoxin reductase
MTDNQYPHLFSQLTIKGLHLKNRMIMAPMATHYATFGGDVSQRLIDYYAERAKGGVALVTVEAAAISPEGVGWTENLSVDHDRRIPGLHTLAASIQNNGAKASLEIFHTGRRAKSAVIGQQPVAPSGIPAFNGEMPRQLLKKEIHRLVEQYAEAAGRAKKAGFDAVNIHMAHGYLIQQFLSPLSNYRNDEYGGDFDGRCRFAAEVIRGVREEVGDHFPIFCRLTSDEGRPDGITPELSREISRKLVEAGADVIDVSAGGPEMGYLVTQTMSMEPGCLTYLSEGIKDSVSVPVAVVGRINTPEVAEEILKTQKADLVVMGRALIADPYLPAKAESGQAAFIRPCIACGQGCSGRLAKGLEIACMTNPYAGREGLWTPAPPREHGRAMVIGAGIAGMSAANDLAEGGWEVDLYEKSDKLGGQGNLASRPSHKKEIMRLLHYLEEKLSENRVTVHLQTEVTQDLVESYNPQIIINASGSIPRRLNVPGLESTTVLTAWDVMAMDECPGERIALIGGGEVGLETAEVILDQGKSVYVLEMLAQVGQGMDARDKQLLMKRLEKTSVELITQARIVKVDGKTVYFEREGIELTLDSIDTVVFAVGSAPAKLPFLEELTIPVYSIGDSVAPRRMFEAVHEAARVVEMS